MLLEFINKHWALCLLTFGGITLTLGDIVMKKWILSGQHHYYIFGLVIWIIGLNFLAFYFKYKNIAVASIIFVILNSVTLLIASYYLYREKISYQEIVGIVLGLTEIAFLSG